MERITSLFYFILQLANLIGPSQEKILKTTLEVFIYKDVLPPLWFKYIHEKVRTLGKSLWYKIQDC
jgi:hypothetical protein